MVKEYNNEYLWAAVSVGAIVMLLLVAMIVGPYFYEPSAEAQAETPVIEQPAEPVPHDNSDENAFDSRLNRMVDELEKAGYHCRELQTDTDE